MSKPCQYWFSLWLFLTVLLPARGGAQSLMYSSKEIRGQVVDADTNQPIEEAVVVLTWLLSPTMWGHESYDKRLHIAEVVADASGQYIVPAWGPKVLPPLSELDDTNPRLAIFKSGYKPKWLHNESHQTGPLLDADWNGRVIKLERFQGTIEQEARYVNSFYGELWQAHDEDEWSDWKNYPQAILEICEAMHRLKSLGLKPGYGPIFPGREGSLEKSAREFLKGHEK
jgi:hypothetical protein